MPNKKEKSPLRMTPPEEIDDLEKAREEFLSEPETKRKSQQINPKNSDEIEQEELPWEKADVTERVIKTFNLRLPEPDFLKLKYVVEKSNEKSMHAFCANLIKKEIEKRL